MFRVFLVTLVFLTSPLVAQTKSPTPKAVEAAIVHYTKEAQLGHYSNAYGIAKAAIALSESVHGENAVITLDLRLKLAQVAVTVIGRKQTLQIYTDLNKRWKDNYSPYHPSAILARIEYAGELSHYGNTAEALPIALEALSFAESVFGDDESITVVWKTRVAGMYSKLGYVDEALTAFKSARAFHLKQPSDLATRRAANLGVEIALILDRARRSPEAAPYWSQAIPEMNAAFGRDHPRTLEAELNYLTNLFRTKSYDQMESMAAALKPRIEKVFGRDGVHMANLLKWLGLRMASISKPGDTEFAQGIELTQAAADLFVKNNGPTSSKAGEVFLDLTNMLADTDQFAAALVAAKGAEDAGFLDRGTHYDTIWDAQGAGVLTPQQAARRAYRIAQVSHRSVYKKASQQQGARLELGYGPGADALRETTDRVEREAVLTAQLSNLINQPLAKRDRDAETTLRSEISANATAISRLTKFVTEKVPAAAALNGNAVLSVEETQRLLKPNQALVIVDLANTNFDYTYVVAVTHDDIVWASPNGTANDFRNASADVRKGIDLRFGLRSAQSLDDDTSNSPSQTFDYFAAYYLYQSTFGLIENLLGDKDHLFVELRGAISGLPPALLIKEEPSDTIQMKDVHWMIKDHAITIVPAAFSLKVSELANVAAPDRRALAAFADPVFEGPAAGEKEQTNLTASQGDLRGALAPLPETRAEVRAVAQALGPQSSTIFEGAAASEAAVKSAELNEFKILYFATHGLVAGDVVQNGKLAEPALALTAGDGEDGLLKHSEITGLSLNADLVVLSACNTAVGGAPGADALSGLAQAFTYAGARALMVSHWPVESNSAVALMTDIFARRAQDNTLGMAQAQRLSVLKMIHNPKDSDWSHPAFWAPFILVGSPD